RSSPRTCCDCVSLHDALPILKKMAATFASTGTPSFFLHSTEGMHGALGLVADKDVVILISNSGETQEVLSVLSSLDKIQAKKIRSEEHTSELQSRFDLVCRLL